MVKFNCIVLFFICPLIYFAQQVNKVEASQQGQNIVVTYDLETEQPCTINLFISTNGGTTWQGPLKQVQGQVGPNIKSGQNSITLFVLTEFNELRGDNIRFKVDALTNNLNTIKIGSGIGKGSFGRVIGNLEGRVVVKQPEYPSDTKEEGKVVVEITVDSEGNVIEANPNGRGTTTSSSLLKEKAKLAALATKFNVDAKFVGHRSNKDEYIMPDLQSGTITFVFFFE